MGVWGGVGGVIRLMEGGGKGAVSEVGGRRGLKGRLMLVLQWFCVLAQPWASAFYGIYIVASACVYIMYTSKNPSHHKI